MCEHLCSYFKLNINLGLLSYVVTVVITCRKFCTSECKQIHLYAGLRAHIQSITTSKNDI